MISVIVPVYNPGEKFEGCINSILAQTYKDLEIILVDDGSTDGSEKMCDAFMKKNQRISVIHLKNGGVSNARNVGIEEAKGEYIAFIDSDDWIEPEAVEKSIKRIEREESGMAIFAMQIDRFTEERVDSIKLCWKEDACMTTEEIAVNFSSLFYNDYLSSSCTKIFRKSVIDKYKLRFNNKLVMYEDLCFVLEYLSCIKRVSIIKEAYYHYQMNTSVNAISKRKTDALLDNLEVVVKHICKYVKQQNCVIDATVNTIIIDLYIIYLHKMFIEKQVICKRIKSIQQLQNSMLLQEALNDCSIFEARGKFYRILAQSLRKKQSFVTYLLYWKRYRR